MTQCQDNKLIIFISSLILCLTQATTIQHTHQITNLWIQIQVISPLSPIMGGSNKFKRLKGRGRGQLNRGAKIAQGIWQGNWSIAISLKCLKWALVNNGRSGKKVILNLEGLLSTAKRLKNIRRRWGRCRLSAMLVASHFRIRELFRKALKKSLATAMALNKCIWIFSSLEIWQLNMKMRKVSRLAQWEGHMDIWNRFQLLKTQLMVTSRCL